MNVRPVGEKSWTYPELRELILILFTVPYLPLNLGFIAAVGD